MDTLKIDRSFVSGIEHGPHNLAIVRSVLALADGLNLSVTAEGIESDEQQSLLRSLRCGRGQGYLFARPMPAGQIDNHLDLGVTVSPAAVHGRETDSSTLKAA